MHFDMDCDVAPSRQDEDNYWQTLRIAQQRDEEISTNDFMRNAQYHQGRLVELNQEKINLERRALEVHRAIAREHVNLETLAVKFHEDRNNRLLEQETRIRTMKEWFRSCRLKEQHGRANPAAAAVVAARVTTRCDAEASDLSQTNGKAMKTTTTTNEGPSGLGPDEEHHAESLTPNSNPDSPRTYAHAITVVTDSSGCAILPIHRISVRSNAVAVLLEKIPRRPVPLRANASSTTTTTTTTIDDLKKIHDTTEKWVSVMIQATGDVHSSRQCHVCSQGLGPFPQCITVDGLRGCGNCYWLRSKCSMEPPAQEFQMSSATNSHDSRTAPEIYESSRIANGTTTPVTLSRPDSPDKSFGRGSTATCETAEDDAVPIARANLVLKHDGTVYTHPECMVGVPVGKIHPGHPYWDPNWPETVPSIEATLQTWRERLQATQADEEAGLTVVRGMKFQMGRQVNRGETILKFLQEADFSPYQLVAKKYISPRLMAYDTVFRLADTLRNLGTFKTLDVTPLEWMRQRLHEIIEERGADFNLAKVIHDFYHDPKYVCLRHANGKKSIGRPSGMKMMPKDSPNSAQAAPDVKKRKTFMSDETSFLSQRTLAPTPTPTPTPTTTPTPTPTPTHRSASTPRPLSDFQSNDTDKSAPPTRDLSKAAKRLKTRHKGRFNDPDLSYDGYTDVDDYSRAPIGEYDWALHRIKSRLNTAGTGVTQYWHWIPDDGEQLFEHQVLAEGDTPSWGIYAKPIDFHLELGDIQEMRWAADTTKVLVVCKPGVVPSPDGKPRGDIIVQFKRHRTKRRFLTFCRKKGVDLVKIETNVIEQAWKAYESPDISAVADSMIS